MRKSMHQGEQGFVLVAGLMLIVVLTIIGAFATRSAIIDLQIAGNERNYHANFSEADGGSQIAAEVLEQNFSCPGGFPDGVLDGTQTTDDGVTPVMGFVVVTESNIVDNTDKASKIINLPRGRSAGDAFTEIGMAGNSSLLAGSSLSIGSGYEGLGRGSGSGGSKYDHGIETTRTGVQGGRTTIEVDWRHIVGLEDSSCIY